MLPPPETLGLRVEKFEGVVAGRGFEPRLTASEAAVLPLDDPASRFTQCELFEMCSDTLACYSWKGNS